MTESSERSRLTAERYILPPGLQYAIEGAMALGQPLLLTGEPGTGKTTLADWAVHYLYEKSGGQFHHTPLRFNTKTTSKATDLFYTYDALSHFQAANLRGGGVANPAGFIELQALGKAIAMSNPKTEYANVCRVELPERPLSSVVLIDEVDKAPRDFTNDILDEIENYRFAIREQDNYMLERGPDAQILVIMTSNSEKNLPDAFLRRCAFFHIKFPEGEQLRAIVQKHIGFIAPETETAYEELFQFFAEARKTVTQKKPATAELIGWLRLLSLNGYFSEKSEGRKKELLMHNLAFLVKTQEDLEVMRKLL